MHPLQDAINHADGPLILSPNAPPITEPLAIQPYTTIIGGSVWLADDFRGNAIFDTGQGDAGRVRVSNVFIDGNDHEVIGIWLQQVQPGSYVRDCRIVNVKRSGICLGSRWGVCNGVFVQNNILTRCGQRSSTADLSALSIVNGVDCHLIHNVIQDSVLGIDLELHGFEKEILYNLVVHGNSIRTSEGLSACWGVSVLGRPNNLARNISVKGNILIGPDPTKAELLENGREVVFDNLIGKQ